MLSVRSSTRTVKHLLCAGSSAAVASPGHGLTVFCWLTDKMSEVWTLARVRNNLLPLLPPARRNNLLPEVIYRAFELCAYFSA